MTRRAGVLTPAASVGVATMHLMPPALKASSMVRRWLLVSPAWWNAAPPDLSWVYGGFTMAGGLMRPVLRVEWPTSMIFITAGAMFVTALLAALYPAWRSARVPPADTLAGR